MSAIQSISASKEELLVAELELLGIRYLSRQSAHQADHVRPPESLLADLIEQPSARVRLALIPLLLAHPELAAAAPRTVRKLPPAQQLLLRVLYTAAVYLQRLHADALRTHCAERWQWLPDLFSSDLGLTGGGDPRAQLTQLGRAYQDWTGSAVNWAGSYADAANRLLRQWEMERLWKT